MCGISIENSSLMVQGIAWIDSCLTEYGISFRLPNERVFTTTTSTGEYLNTDLSMDAS
jgi:hypothetical protein